jgi:hypothetical protein
MADNIGYTPGSGATIAADDVGGVLYQRVKIAVGEENSAADVSEAFPFPVVMIADESMATSQILQYLDSPRGYDKSIQRQRVTAVLESGTVTTVSNLAAVDGYNGRIQVLGQNLTAWAQCVRARIS